MISFALTFEISRQPAVSHIPGARQTDCSFFSLIAGSSLVGEYVRLGLMYPLHGEPLSVGRGNVLKRRPSLFTKRIHVLLRFLGTTLHILPSSHFSNLRIDVIASEGDLVVSYEEKTLIMWDMKAGAQKATFTADKVKDLDVALIFLFSKARQEINGLVISSLPRCINGYGRIECWVTVRWTNIPSGVGGGAGRNTSCRFMVLNRKYSRVMGHCPAEMRDLNGK